MTYSYLRVSCLKQNITNQRFEVEKYAKENGIVIDAWITETISGTKRYNDRKLGKLLKRLKKNDTLILPELSRLGRSLMEIFSILNMCLEKEVNIIAIKENYKLTNTLEAKVIAFAFSIASEVERRLISLRTREALARKKAEGIKLGRPKNVSSKLKGKETEIKELISSGIPKTQICKKFKISRSTLYKFIYRKTYLN